MALQIKKTENVFILKGTLHSNQVFEIRNFFQHKLKSDASLTISLAGLDDLDLSAALMFKQLKDEAYRINKRFTVFSAGNKKVLGPFLMLEEPVLLAAA